MPRRGGVPRFFDLEVIALNLTVEIKETWAHPYNWIYSKHPKSD
jgi:hypothetical protein